MKSFTCWFDVISPAAGLAFDAPYGSYGVYGTCDEI